MYIVRHAVEFFMFDFVFAYFLDILSLVVSMVFHFILLKRIKTNGYMFLKLHIQYILGAYDKMA